MKRLFGLATSHLICDMFNPILPAVMPLLITTYGYSYLMVGLLVTVYQLTSSILQPVVGWLHDRKGHGVHVSIAILMSAAGMSFLGVAGAYPLLILCAIISGLGHALFHPSALAAVSDIAEGESRGRLTSIFVVGGNLGFAIGPLVAGLLLQWGGLPAILLLLVPGVLMAALLRILMPGREGSPAQTRTASETVVGGRPTEVKAILVLISASALRAWAIFGIVAYLPTFLTLRGYDIGIANAVVSTMLIGGVIGQVVGGTASDRYGRKEFTLAGLAAAIPAFAIFILTDGVLSLAALLLFGFFLWSTFSVTLAMGHEMLPSRVGLVSGLMLGFAVGAGGSGVAITGWIADSLSLSAAISMLAVPIIAAIALFAILPYPWKSLRGHTSH